MPLPKTATTIKGGCNCGAIRYKIDVPDFKDRVLHPAYPINTASKSSTTSTTSNDTASSAATTAAADGAGSAANEGDDDDPDAIKFPFIATCHCNDCRAATAGIVGAWICCPASTVMVSAISRSSEVAREASSRPFKGKTFLDDDKEANPTLSSSHFSTEATGKLRDRIQDPSSSTTSTTSSDSSSSESSSSPPYRPGMEMLLPTPHSRDTFIHFHHSSNARTRTFCGRCGTPMSYNIWPMAHGLPDILDIVLATVDRGPVPEARPKAQRGEGQGEGGKGGESRETLEDLEPDVQLWWDYGVPWVKKMSSGLTGVPRYANWRVNKPVVD